MTTTVSSLPPNIREETAYGRYVLNGFRYGFLFIVTFIMLAPVLLAFLGAIRTSSEFQARPFDIPRRGIQWHNFTEILEDSNFWLMFKNSLYITIGATVLTVLVSSLLGYIFARVEFRGRGLLFNVVTLGLLFPFVIAILPIFIQIRKLGLLNSYWGVILPLVAFSIPGSTLILRGFFRAIPYELEEAAYIDGCTVFGFFYRILLPMARPAVTAIAVLQAIAAWNDYFLALLILTDESKWTLPLGLMQFQGQYGTTNWSGIMAYVTILMIPAILFYMVTERYIVTGLTGGELKG
ncbi:MAG: thiamine ABC transporter ATP-binding protein [Phototrophicales bacterium]|nr:MAG: thiamine ABC transporter ATP-binding protein [Phototrophicales bacterium]